MSAHIDQRHLLNKCLVIDLRRSPGSRSCCSDGSQSSMEADEDGFAVFKAWLSVNLETYWSPPLLSALRRLTLVGLLRPCLLLVTAAPGHLEVIRTAWCQRTLRAPPGYRVAMLGEAHGYNVTPVAPGQFTSLPEAICYVIQTLNAADADTKVTLDDVCCHLRRHFPHLELPDRGLVFSTLGRLVRERKIYHTRQGYQIVTPDTYQRHLAAEMEREAVRAGRNVHRSQQTDLADIILGGSDTDPVIHARPLPGGPLAPPIGLSAFARRHSLKLSANQREEYFRRASSMRYPAAHGPCPKHTAGVRRHFTDETPTSDEFSVLERPSLFTKLLRLAVPRRQLATFSAQFPPPEWTAGDVTHLHSVATQTSRPPAERSPKVIRSRRHKKTRPLNGSIDHLAEAAETAASISPPQVAPRSSTLPRRTKLAEFLAESAGEREKSPTKPKRRHRSPRKHGERLKSTGDLLRVIDPGKIKGKDLRVLEPGKARSKVDSAASHNGVTPEPAGGSPSHAESLAQRHVRERLEARARHSSSRTSSGSSLERSDNSLERDARLELPRQQKEDTGRDGDATSRRESSRHCSRHINSSQNESSLPGSKEHEPSVPGSKEHESTRPGSKEDHRIDIRPSSESSPSRKEHKSPRRRDKDLRLVEVSKTTDVEVNGERSRHGARGDDSPAAKPADHRHTRESSGDSKQHARESSRDSQHHSRESRGSPKHHTREPPEVSKHHARESTENSKQQSRESTSNAKIHARESREVSKHIVREPIEYSKHRTRESPEVPKYHAGKQSQDAKSQVRDKSRADYVNYPPSPQQNGKPSEIKRNKGYVNQDVNHSPSPQPDGKHGEIKRNQGYVNQDVVFRTTVAKQLAQNAKQGRHLVPKTVSHVENREYFDVYNGEGVAEHESPVGQVNRRGNEPVYQNIGVLAVEEVRPSAAGRDKPSREKPQEDVKSTKPESKGEVVRVQENGQVISPKHRDRTSPSHGRDRETSSLKGREVRADAIAPSDVRVPFSAITPAEASSELRTGRPHKDQNTSSVWKALERKQMNNEKVLEAISPTRPERLSVKNIFHELSAPAKVPPKSLPDGISPDQRFTRPLTYHDLVKTPPAKMADVSLPGSKMADAALTTNKMADTVATRPAEPTTDTTEKRASSPGDTSLRTYPSLSSLNLNFKSLAAQRLMHGASANSIDTLVEVNMAAERRRSAGGTETTLLGIL